MEALGWEAEVDFCWGVMGWVQWEPRESVSTSSSKAISFPPNLENPQAGTATPTPTPTDRAPGKVAEKGVVAKKYIFALLKAQL